MCRRRVVCVLSVCLLVGCSASRLLGLQYHSGDVWGIWTAAGNPHIVIGDVRVPPDSILVIEPGCDVRFRDYYALIVDSSATLLAIGSAADSILFDVESRGIFWHGVRFRNAADASTLSYCRMRHGNARGPGQDGQGGAIACWNANPRISHCAIDSNEAENSGGGIYCLTSDPEIVDCRMQGNSARYGGAVSCSGSNPTIRGNRFILNSAVSPTFGGGGAVYCFPNSSPAILGNTFEGNTGRDGGALFCHQNSNPLVSANRFIRNQARWGGAVYCADSKPRIAGNVFEENSTVADGSGGAIQFDYTRPVLTSNSFTLNWARSVGGAITCFYPGTSRLSGGAEFRGSSRTPLSPSAADESPLVSNNVFLRNRASSGGAICGYHSSLTLKNCVLWNDRAPEDPEIHLGAGATADVTYCDVAGGWQGEGNVNLEPRFVNPDSGNVHLHADSPAIDAGDPRSPLDPDSTIADMGSAYFDQSRTPSIELHLHGEPVSVAPQGGRLWFDGWVYNLADTSVRVDIWTYAVLPDSSRVGPLKEYRGQRIAASGRIGLNNLSEYVPGRVPEGVCRYVAYSGEFGVSIADSSSFIFLKQGGQCGPTR